MKVKHLIRELQKCDPDREVVVSVADDHWYTYSVGRQSDNRDCVIIFVADEDSLDYDNREDSPKPI
jgi:hypothetical protein